MRAFVRLNKQDGGNRWEAGMKKLIAMALCLLMAALWTACAEGQPGEVVLQAGNEAGVQQLSLPPAVALLPEIGEDGQLVYESEAGGERAAIDLSNLHRGFIAVRCEAGRAARLVLAKDEKQQTETIPAAQGYTVYPLEMGDGAYTAKVFLNLEGMNYESVLETAFELKIEHEEYRYLIPNHRVPYEAESSVAELARTLRIGAQTEAELVADAASWIVGNISYTGGPAAPEDEAAAPDLERVLAEKEGMCADFAALFAALLRINQIPCKVVFGMVETPEGPVYHAWNLALPQDAQDDGQWLLYDTTLGAEPPGAFGAYSYGEARRVY